MSIGRRGGRCVCSCTRTRMRTRTDGRTGGTTNGVSTLGLERPTATAPDRPHCGSTLDIRGHFRSTLSGISSSRVWSASVQWMVFHSLLRRDQSRLRAGRQKGPPEHRQCTK